MGAALSVFVILSVSIFVIRLASVALRITGIPDESARFQALSAFSGTGFTTREAETIINYPVRRKIISLMMVIGNIGLVSVFATVVVSLVQTDGNTDAILRQVFWLALGLGLIWFIVLNKTADRILCAQIAKLLATTTLLGTRPYQKLLQISEGYSVCEHPVSDEWAVADTSKLEEVLKDSGLLLLRAKAKDGQSSASVVEPLENLGSLVLFGPDDGHDQLAQRGVPKA
jgi:hypothetical protein